MKTLIEEEKTKNDKPRLAKSWFEWGSAVLSTDRTEEALTALKNSAEIYRTLGDSINYAWCLYKISYLHNLAGDYSKSFNDCLHANSIAENNSATSLEGFTSNLLGRLYYLLSDETSAMSLYEKALQNGKAARNDKLTAEALSYMAIVWRNRDSLALSMKMQKEALALREKAADRTECASSYLNIGILYSYMRQNDTAIAWLTKAEGIWKETNDYFNLTECYNYLGKSHLKLKNISLAESYFNRSLGIALHVRAKKMIRYNYYDLAMISYDKGDTKKAFDQILLYTIYKDSVIQDQGLLEITHLEKKNLKEKNENEIKLLNKENELKESLLARNQIIIWSGVFGSALLVLLSAFIFRSFYITRKQKQIIEEKNKDITDSINYAKRIQEAILPDKKILQGFFQESFVLFMPKDVVSGDFFWFAEKNGKKIVVAADCTGHGVPGAFMSMIGNAFLNETIIEKGITDADKILSELRFLIINALKQTSSDSSAKDGMDLALLCIDENNSTAEFAGANNPMLRYRKENGAWSVYKYKPNKRPIGYYMGRGLPFFSEKTEIRKGDTYYIFTDGYADQFGGSKRKKYMYKQLESKLMELIDLPLKEQKIILETVFNEWKGNLDQVDDVLVIGIRI